jgi:hypothetical protein
VHARWVVEALDVVEDRKPGLLAGGEVEVVDPLGLERMKKALSHGVVLEVAGTAHAANHAVSIELLLVLGAQVLAPVVCQNSAEQNARGSRGLADSRRK